MSLPTTHKVAIFHSTTDNLDDVQVTEVPLKAPTRNQVLIKNEFAACNPVDKMVVSGMLAGAGWALPMPLVPGYDFAGTVAAVGEGVSGFQVGERVFGVNWGQGKHDDGENAAEESTVAGAFAEYIALPASKVSKTPKDLSSDKAAAVALVGTTAHDSLFKYGELSAGQKVLILGGAGAVGNLAVQLAKNKGAWVATTSSSRTEEFVSTLGADKVVNYTKEEWWNNADLKGVDLVFDAVGEAASFDHAKAVLKTDGKYVSIANHDAGYDPKAHAPLTFASFICLSNSVAVQDELAKMIVEGSLKVQVENEYSFSLDGVKSVFKKQSEGKSIGKNVLKF
eukprot:GFYU01001868.1.p1 GENE.GFYU01001868.1~~GFYU01001868.1.p1  ORF type:complete len:338 (+),score=130.50 GFYU01001868.1:134-1147(+)